MWHSFMEGVNFGLSIVGGLLPLALFAGIVMFALIGINIKEKKNG